MSFVDKLKDALFPDADPGVIYRCTECGTPFDEPRERCPECGSAEIKEEEGFQMRPNA